MTMTAYKPAPAPRASELIRLYRCPECSGPAGIHNGRVHVTHHPACRFLPRSLFHRDRDEEADAA